MLNTPDMLIKVFVFVVVVVVVVGKGQLQVASFGDSLKCKHK